MTLERLLVVLALAGCVCIGIEKALHHCPAQPVRAEDFRP